MGNSKYKSYSLQEVYKTERVKLAAKQQDIVKNNSICRTAATENESDVKILSFHFYNGGSSAPDEVEREFKTRFSRNNAQFIYFQLSMTNPWQYNSFKYHLTARYYHPDNTLMGEIESSFNTDPDWKTFWHSRGLGWDTTRQWTPGIYRVEIYINYKHRITKAFTIFNDDSILSRLGQPGSDPFKIEIE